MSISAQHKIFRIKKNTEIKFLLSNGRKMQTKHGLFFLEENNRSDLTGFAVLIKKNVGNAVWRNYCKRIVRVYIRKNVDNIKKYQRIMFLYNFEGKITYRALEKEFNKHLKTA